jgi:hypothetical protein
MQRFQEESDSEETELEEVPLVRKNQYWSWPETSLSNKQRGNPSNTTSFSFFISFFSYSKKECLLLFLFCRNQ